MLTQLLPRRGPTCRMCHTSACRTTAWNQIICRDHSDHAQIFHFIRCSNAAMNRPSERCNESLTDASCHICRQLADICSSQQGLMSPLSWLQRSPNHCNMEEEDKCILRSGHASEGRLWLSIILLCPPETWAIPFLNSKRHLQQGLYAHAGRPLNQVQGKGVYCSLLGAMVCGKPLLNKSAKRHSHATLA